jgi:hypothetical protein
LPSAEKALAAIWMITERNEAVTAASYQIDRDLQTDAALNGTPLREGFGRSNEHRYVPCTKSSRRIDWCEW